MQAILEKIRKTEGLIGFYYSVLDSDEKAEFQKDLPLIAASVIKIPIMIEAFRRFYDGTLDPDSIYIVHEDVKMPSCGALNRMHEGLCVTIRDLVELMIILSDNSAANILIDMLGVERINETLAQYGVTNSVLRRKLFDMAGWRAGINNHITAGDMGRLLELLYHGRIISAEASKEMLDILLNQRLNSKFPFFLESHGIECAHKTGEDDNITHDVGIIFTKHPFVLCMVSNKTDVPAFERLMQDTAWALAQRNNQ